MFIYRHFDLPAVNGKFRQFTADKRPVNGKNTHFRNKKFMPAKCFKICIFYVYEISYCFFHFTFHVTLLFPLWLPNSISTKIRAFKREKIKLLKMKMKKTWVFKWINNSKFWSIFLNILLSSNNIYKQFFYEECNANHNFYSF